MRGKVLHLSQHKFASNVVEKCVQNATKMEKAVLIDEVCIYGFTLHHGLVAIVNSDYLVLVSRPSTKTSSFSKYILPSPGVHREQR